ncbi:hypothetical protein GCM10022419_098130 [Nonomuraea rosea]|uniref:Calcium-binding protein n=1 Tax=Nonomuraea rosea TaxID=638574 RepID=A0ABP6Z7A8_9ACTN
MKNILSILGLALAMAGLQATFAMPSHADTLAALLGNNLQVVAAAGKVNNITISTDAAGNVLVSDTGDVVRTGNGAANEIRGGSGDDVINTVDGIGGNDTLSAAGGTDTCNSDAGDIELTCEI